MTTTSSRTPVAPVLPQRPKPGALIRASGGPRYAVALIVDALGSGMLRPFLLLFGIQVLHLSVAGAGAAMSVGMLAGLGAVPFAGRWIDRGVRTAAVAAAMLVRVLGVAVLLVTPLLGGSPLWGFTTAALFLGIGNQCWTPAHAAFVSTVAEARYRDAALATGRSLRNAGLGAGALIATVSTAGGAGALRTMAVLTALGYLVGAGLVLSLRVRVRVPVVEAGMQPAAPSASAGPSGSRGRGRVRVRGRGRARGRGRSRLTVLDVANLPYAFCFNVLEVALPAFLVTRLHVAPAWSAGIFVGNTVLVVATQIAVVMWLARFARRSALAASGVVLAVSYLGFWAAGTVGGWGAAAGIAAVSVLYTAGEIMYTGSATALIVASTDPARLGSALSRFQLSSGIGLATSPAVLTLLLDRGSAALWGVLALTTLLAAVAIRRWSPAGQP
ncbi:MFS transporter [Streptacidiphilus cavernicola]|uniref:MFS transporter n=1 Tax=Streptacidiphilus cavernicola TaxID=3342716 RepID=A0ABV6W2F9_9ACTN